MDFKTITTILFQDKHRWNQIEDNDKETFFFIFNRFMSKKYPKQAQYFNDKNIDKATSFDVWFEFLKKERKTPFWFWRGPTKKKDPDIKEWQIVRDFYELDLKNIYLLCELFPDEFKSEIKRINLINKEMKI